VRFATYVSKNTNLEQIILCKQLNPVHTIKISLPDMSKLMSGVNILSFSETKITLNVNLFHALCVRNIHGFTNYTDMMHYAIGYSKTRFTTSN